MLGRLIGEDVALDHPLDQTAGCVRADPGQLEQVIVNLAVNARDAMPLGGRLTLETSSVRIDEALARQHGGRGPGRYVRLVVRDTGVGMDALIEAPPLRALLHDEGAGQRAPGSASPRSTGS